MSGKYTKVENPSEEILTYITTAKDMIYVYAVVDLCGKIVLFYHIGNNMMISLITYSIWEASQKETMNLTSTATRGRNTPYKNKFNNTTFIRQSPDLDSCMTMQQWKIFGDTENRVPTSHEIYLSDRSGASDDRICPVLEF